MNKRVICLLLSLLLCGTMVLSVSADIVEPQPEPEVIDALSGLELGPVLLIAAAVLAVAVAVLVLILIFVKKKK